MPTPSPSPSKGELTRQRILDAALLLFRTRGFAATTMRDIAQVSELSLGAAYHYFPSKEALLLAYYENIEERHEKATRDRWETLSCPLEKLDVLLRLKLDLLRRDRKLLLALLSTLSDPSHPTSVFAKETTELRNRSVAQFQSVFAAKDVPNELQELLGRAAWLAHLGIFMVFVQDEANGELRARKLIRALTQATGWALPLLKLKASTILRRKLVAVVADLGLF